MKDDKKVNKDDIELDNDPQNLDDSVVAEENTALAVKKLREKLKTCEHERQEYLSGWQRAKADLINARKRDEETSRDLAKFANGQLIDDLVPVLESFDLAMADKQAWEKADKNWRTGVEYIYSQLKKTLLDKGLEEINPLNQKFDHTQHEAVQYEPTNDEKLDRVIVKVIQKGYSLHGKLLRPPKVNVAEYQKG